MSSPQREYSRRNASEQQTLKGCYRLEGKVGGGGMATVYRATHLDLQLPVAVKLMHSEMANNPQLRERFLQEAQIQFKLKHPHIVQVTDFIQEPGAVGYVLEWIDGIDLKTWLAHRQEPLSEVEIVGLMDLILLGVGYAHGQGVIHRDLKPSNILLHVTNRTLNPKVADFGIAKRLMSTEEPPITQNQESVGTLHYMAPEQINSANTVDHRADIYSVGVMLFELATGQLPFGGTSYHLMYAHIWQPPPSPCILRPSLSPALEAVILRCLEKNPDMRFQNVSLLQMALQQVLAVPSISSVREPVEPSQGSSDRRFSVVQFVGWLFFLLGLGVSGVWGWQTLFSEPDSSQPPNNTPNLVDTAQPPRTQPTLLTPATPRSTGHSATKQTLVLQMQNEGAKGNKDLKNQNNQNRPKHQKEEKDQNHPKHQSPTGVSSPTKPRSFAVQRKPLSRSNTPRRVVRRKRRPPKRRHQHRRRMATAFSRDRVAGQKEQQRRYQPQKEQPAPMLRLERKPEPIQRQRVQQILHESCRRLRGNPDRSRYVYRELGDEIVASAPALIQGFRDRLPCVRDVAAYLLVFLARRHESVRQHLQRALQDPHPWVRKRVGSLLSFLHRRYGLASDIMPREQGNSQLAEHYVKGLRDSNVRVRLRTVQALKSSPDNKDFKIRHLLFALRDASPLIRSEVADALVFVQSRDRRVVSALVLLLADSHWTVRKQAAYLLGWTGKSGNTAIPALQKATQDPSPSVQDAARNALQRITGSEE